MAGFLIALLSGALMSVQGVFNAQSDKDDRNLGKLMGGCNFTAFLLCLFSLAGSRKRLLLQSLMEGPAALYVAGRCDRSRDHMDCH